MVKDSQKESVKMIEKFKQLVSKNYWVDWEDYKQMISCREWLNFVSQTTFQSACNLHKKD